MVEDISYNDDVSNKFIFIEEKFEITDNTLFVIDTNYLLYTLQSYFFGEKYIDALNKKIDNLYIPYIAFMEFYRGKDRVIQQINGQIQSLPQAVSFSDTEKLLDLDDTFEESLYSTTFSDYNAYKNKVDHLKFESDELIEKYKSELVEELLPHVEQINNIFDNIKKNNKERIENSFVKAQDFREKAEKLTILLAKIINTDGVLGRAYSKGFFERETFIALLNYRYENEVPPGYKDKNKAKKVENKSDIDNFHIFGEILYPKESGDLILWLDTINYIQETKDKYDNVIIVTDDNKEDWLQRKYDKIHPNLKIEFYQKTGKNIDIMKTEDFILKFAEFNNKEKLLFTKDYESLRENEKDEELEDIKDYSIKFEFLGTSFSSDSQNQMMEQIITKISQQFDIYSKDIEHISCFSVVDKPEEMSPYDKYFISKDAKVVHINRRYSIYGKLKFIKQIFDVLSIEYDSIVFTGGFIKQYNSSYQEIWEETIAE